MTEPTREEWLEGRKKGIGGSDWEGILSIEPYGCARRCWYSKTNHEPDYPDRDSGVLKRGRKLEPMVFEEFEDHSGRRLDFCPQGEDASRWFESAYGLADEVCPGVPRPDWWIGTPDAVIPMDPGEPSHGNFEAKTSSPWVYSKILKEGIPERTLAQRQHYLGLSGFDWGVVGYLEPSSWSFMPIPYERENTMLAAMVNAGNRFWKRVEERAEPERLEMGDARCRSCQFHFTCWQTHELFEGGGTEAAGDYLPNDDPAFTQMYDRCIEARKLVKVSEEEKEIADLDLFNLLGGVDKCGGTKYVCEAGKLRVSDGKYTRTDMKEFAAAYPRLDAAIKEKFKRTKQGSPSLYFYPRKED